MVTTASNKQEGNRNGSPRLRPLRTVRASFPAYGSSTLKARPLLLPYPAVSTGFKVSLPRRVERVTR